MESVKIYVLCIKQNKFTKKVYDNIVNLIQVHYRNGYHINEFKT